MRTYEQVKKEIQDLWDQGMDGSNALLDEFDRLWQDQLNAKPICPIAQKEYEDSLPEAEDEMTEYYNQRILERNTI